MGPNAKRYDVELPTTDSRLWGLSVRTKDRGTVRFVHDGTGPEPVSVPVSPRPTPPPRNAARRNPRQGWGN